MCGRENNLTFDCTRPFSVHPGSWQAGTLGDELVSGDRLITFRSDEVGAVSPPIYIHWEQHQCEGQGVRLFPSAGFATQSSEAAGLMVALVQTLIFVALGPIVLFYGRAVQKSVIFIQSAFAANYLAFAGEIAAVTPMTALGLVDRLIMLVSATLTLMSGITCERR